MPEYIVSARKYRPDSFNELIGQDNISQTLRNSIVRGKLAHAYLFCGPRGVGKTSMARIFAKAINCANPSPEMEPCGECESCVSFREGRSYCIHELDAASNNGVDDIKALMEQVQIPPQTGKYSVYIIDEVHMLSPSAFNAFLKTLEEPPAHAVFILATTEKHKILPTILSRCQTYDFNRISITDMVRNLREIAQKEGVTIDDSSLHVIAQKADGAMRDALTIFDQTVAFCGTEVKYADVIRNLNVLDSEYSFNLVGHFLKGDYASALLLFDEVLSKGFNALHFVSSLSSHLRDLLVASCAGAESLLEVPDSMREKYAAQASQCPRQFLYDALSAATACEAGYKAAVNPRLHIEFMLMKLCFMAVPPKDGVQAAAKPVAAEPAVKPVAAVAEPVAAPVAKPAEPVAQPAPAVEAAPAPAPTPAPRKRAAAKKASSLSLGAMLQEQEEKGAQPSGGEAAPEGLPSDDALAVAFKGLSEDYKAGMPRLASMISNAALEFSEEGGRKRITFKVMNVSQQKWIEEKLLHELEGKLQKAAGSPAVALAVGIVPDTEKKDVLYTDNEKAAFLMKGSSEVKGLVTDLGLDTIL